jgi:hypothetical protein
LYLLHPFPLHLRLTRLKTTAGGDSFPVGSYCDLYPAVASAPSQTDNKIKKVDAEEDVVTPLVDIFASN